MESGESEQMEERNGFVSTEVWIRNQIQEINEIRERFVGETGILADGFSGKKKTVEEYCRYLYEFIVQSQIQQKLKGQELYFHENGNKAMEKEYAQIFGIMMELLDKMAEILGDEMVSPEEFRQILETGMTQAKVALIPPSMDQVLVGDMERTTAERCKSTVFCRRK